MQTTQNTQRTEENAGVVSEIVLVMQDILHGDVVLGLEKVQKLTSFLAKFLLDFFQKTLSNDKQFSVI